MPEPKAAVVANNRTLTREPLALVPTPSPNFINRIVNGDCLTILPQLDAGSVDFVLTDPPYLARYRDRSDRTVLNDDRDRRLMPAFTEIYRVLKPDRFCVSFYGWHYRAVQLYMCSQWDRLKLHGLFRRGWSSGLPVATFFSDNEGSAHRAAGP